MISIVVNNVTEALWLGIMEVHAARSNGSLVSTTPRGLDRLEFPCPFSTTYRYPRQRVLVDPVRDANPFFHFMESLWIINGSNNADWLAQWLPSITDFSDDGRVFHGAYGLRVHGQLAAVLDRLKRDPMNTRTVLQIYDYTKDSRYYGLDMPCNCMIFLLLREGRLNITVCNRSNDMILGAYGANAVQFSMLQEYIADKLDVEVGTYTQFSNNMHVYPGHPVTQRLLDRATPFVLPDYYNELEHAAFSEGMAPYPMNAHTVDWNVDLSSFMWNDKGWTKKYHCRFFNKIAAPMARAHLLYREKMYSSAIAEAANIEASDWRRACMEWLQRREQNAVAKAEGV